MSGKCQNHVLPHQPEKTMKTRACLLTCVFFVLFFAVQVRAQEAESELVSFPVWQGNQVVVEFAEYPECHSDTFLTEASCPWQAVVTLEQSNLPDELKAIKQNGLYLGGDNPDDGPVPVDSFYILYTLVVDCWYTPWFNYEFPDSTDNSDENILDYVLLSGQPLLIASLGGDAIGEIAFTLPTRLNAYYPTDDAKWESKAKNEFMKHELYESYQQAYLDLEANDAEQWIDYSGLEFSVYSSENEAIAVAQCFILDPCGGYDIGGYRLIWRIVKNQWELISATTENECEVREMPQNVFTIDGLEGIYFFNENGNSLRIIEVIENQLFLSLPMDYYNDGEC